MIDPSVHGFTNPLVDRLPLSGRPENAPARDSYTPPQDGPSPTGAPWHKAYSLMEDAPVPPQVNTYDVWSRKDSAPARNSYTPPPVEEGSFPRPAPWNKAYSLMEDAPVPPFVNTYDVWSRKDSAPARNSYTPPAAEAGAAPTPAPWHKAYALNQDLPEYIPPTLSTYNIWNRKDAPPARESYTPPSGQKPPVWYPAYVQASKHDISKAELDALILNDHERMEKPYDYNGVANKASANYKGLSQYDQPLSDPVFNFGHYHDSTAGGWIDHLQSFDQRRGGWVDKAKIDERVEDFVNREVHEGLDANWPRSETAMENNGHKANWPDAAALYQTRHHRHNRNNDISEK